MMCGRMDKIRLLKNTWQPFQTATDTVLASRKGLGSGVWETLITIQIERGLGVAVESSVLLTECTWGNEFPSLNYDFIILTLRTIILPFPGSRDILMRQGVGGM